MNGIPEKMLDIWAKDKVMDENIELKDVKSIQDDNDDEKELE